MVPEEQAAHALVRVEGDVATLLLNRPAVRNALARSVHHALGAALDRVAARSDVSFVVLRGVGGTFSSGGDLKELSTGLPPDYLEDYLRRMEATVLRLRRLPLPVVAVVEGFALGAGASLALAADIVLAARNARFGFGFVRLGLVPDAGATVLLPRLVGAARARDLLLTGRPVDADEAQAMGLVSRVVEPEEIDRALEGVLGELRQSPPASLALTKQLLEQHAIATYADGVRAEGVAQLAAAHRGGYRGRIAALLATSKRRPASG